jgi:arylsulfatase A-like enzyme/Tfp pilus assembly protein PilF
MHPVPPFGADSGLFRSRSRIAAGLVLGLAAAAMACGRAPSGEPTHTRARPDIVLITVDTLRADRVGRGLTPTLDALATRGVHFTQARATVPLTLPSHATILTGALPAVHGVRENGIHVFSGTPRSIARELQDAGYETAAFVGAYVLDRRFGLADGFDHYDDQIRRDPAAVLRLEAERPANDVVDRTLAWFALSQHRASTEPAQSKSVFVWVHLYDPHAPHAISYDEDVKFADREVGRLLEKLREAGREPVVVVAGDHGESLGEHGERTHGMLLYDGALRVPFIIAGPGVRPARRDEPVSLVDVAPTLLGLAGRTSGAMAGRNLLGDSRRDDEVYAETEYPRVAGWSPVYALLQDRWKLILSSEPELYDLATDPAESKNVAAARQPLVSAMGARLDTLRAATRGQQQRSAAPDVAERLRALGYVAGSAEPPAPGRGPNPADHVAAWGEFEAALAGMTSANSAESLERLKALARKYPDAFVFQSTYAGLLADAGSTRQALDIYRRAVKRWPNEATLFHELAVAARGARLSDEALRAEHAAIALEPTMPAAHNGVGLLMTDLGRHVEASQAFERAVAADPTNAEYWVNLGNARRATSKLAAAEEAYRRAADLDPRSADAANGLGVLLVQQRRPGDAIPWFQRALETTPGFVEARLNLGIAYQESGQHDLARAAYREVLARSPQSARERRAAADLLRSLSQ